MIQWRVRLGGASLPLYPLAGVHGPWPAHPKPGSVGFLGRSRNVALADPVLTHECPLCRIKRPRDCMNSFLLDDCLDQASFFFEGGVSPPAKARAVLCKHFDGRSNP